MYFNLYVIFYKLKAFFYNPLKISGFWLDGPAPLIREEAELRLTKNKKLDDNIRQLQFTING